MYQDWALGNETTPFLRLLLALALLPHTPVSWDWATGAWCSTHILGLGPRAQVPFPLLHPKLGLCWPGTGPSQPLTPGLVPGVHSGIEYPIHHAGTGAPHGFQNLGWGSSSTFHTPNFHSHGEPHRLDDSVASLIWSTGQRLRTPALIELICVSYRYRILH